jgi:hypothetical protein
MLASWNLVYVHTSLYNLARYNTPLYTTCLYESLYGSSDDLSDILNVIYSVRLSNISL